MQHKHPLVQRQNIRPAALQQGHLGAILVKVLRDVVSAVSRADDDDLFPLDIAVCRGILMLAAMVDDALEGVLAWERRDLGFTGVSGAPDEVSRMKHALESVGSGDRHGPFPGVVVVVGALDARPRPHVQLHQAGVGFEPVAQFVLGRELRPVLGEGEVGHVREFDGVVGDEGLHKHHLAGAKEVVLRQG